MLLKKFGFSDGTLCAAVAHHIVLDAAGNTLGTGCFPKITARRSDGNFLIEISTDHDASKFFVTELEAKQMVANLKKLDQSNVVAMDRVQEAVARLEGGSAHIST